MTVCKHEDSLYGRCMACGMTWKQQAEQQAAAKASVHSASDAPAVLSRMLRDREIDARGFYCTETGLFYRDKPQHPGISCCKIVFTAADRASEVASTGHTMARKGAAVAQGVHAEHRPDKPEVVGMESDQPSPTVPSAHGKTDMPWGMYDCPRCSPTYGPCAIHRNRSAVESGAGLFEEPKGGTTSAGNVSPWEKPDPADAGKTCVVCNGTVDARGFCRCMGAGVLPTVDDDATDDVLDLLNEARLAIEYLLPDRPWLDDRTREADAVLGRLVDAINRGVGDSAGATTHSHDLNRLANRLSLIMPNDLIDRTLAQVRFWLAEENSGTFTNPSAHGTTAGSETVAG